LQATRWVDDKAGYYENALTYAKMLRDDWEIDGGANYMTFMYSNFDDIFSEQKITPTKRRCGNMPIMQIRPSTAAAMVPMF
jgi:hypothetical protein